MGKRPIPIGGRTAADDLRDDLKRCEDWVVQIGSGVDGLALLRLLDHVAHQMERLEARGLDLRPERTRLETVLAQLQRRDTKLVAQAGAALAEQRPSEARWWWYLDKEVAARRKRWIMRVTLGALAGAVLLALLYFAYDRLLAPPPHIRQANAHFRDGEDAVIEGDLTGAIEEFEAVMALDPQDEGAYLWLEVLYEATGQLDQARAASERAKTLFDDRSLYFFRRGMIYLMINNTDAAVQDAITSIDAAPERPEGYLLLGSAAEQMDDLEAAVNAFMTASDLAQAAGEDQIYVTTQIHLGVLLQALEASPQGP